MPELLSSDSQSISPSVMGHSGVPLVAEPVGLTELVCAVCVVRTGPILDEDEVLGEEDEQK